MNKRLAKFKTNKWTIIIIGLGLFVLLYVTGIIFPRNKNKDITTANAQYKDIVSSVSASGSVTSDRDVKVLFGTFGKIAELNVNKGDKVQKGDILATIDTVSLYNNYAAAQETYRAALGAKDSAVEARREWLETNEDKEFTDIVRAQRAQLDAAVRGASANAEAAKANIAITQDALTKAHLVAPADGIVLEINNIESGLTVNATSNSYIRIADIGKLKFVANVDEVDLGSIKPNQEVQIELDAYRGEAFTGTVNYIYDFAQKTGAGSMVVPVEISLTGDTSKVRLGLSGDADFIMEKKENALVVPKNALRNGGQRSFVYVVDNTGNIIKKDVKVGVRNSKFIEVIEGLSEGDQVVTSKLENE